MPRPTSPASGCSPLAVGQWDKYVCMCGVGMGSPCHGPAAVHAAAMRHAAKSIASTGPYMLLPTLLLLFGFDNLGHSIPEYNPFR